MILLDKLQNLSRNITYMYKKVTFSGGTQTIGSFWELFGLNRSDIYTYRIGVMYGVSGSYYFSPERINSLFGGTDDASTTIISSDSGGWTAHNFGTSLTTSFSHDNTKLILRNISSGNIVIIYTLR